MLENRGISQKSIYAIKYKNKREYVDFYTDEIAKRYGGEIDYWKADLIMPVPLANRRLFQRGYNQATLLSREIARAYGVPIDFNSVHRKYRPNMGHKTHAQRAQHIRGVFNVKNRDALRGKKILLVDDVMTSGATFNELSRVLRRAGAAEIYGVVFCRVVRAE